MYIIIIIPQTLPDPIALCLLLPSTCFLEEIDVFLYILSFLTHSTVFHFKQLRSLLIFIGANTHQT